ncbi:MAG: hypothetical protein RLZZ437_3063 [Pseudomonadota bacterium]|jgi:hypothetical protein
MTTDTLAPRRLDKMSLGLWGAQTLLALFYSGVGAMKAFSPLESLTQMLPYAGEMLTFVRFIGTMELLGAIGLILPALTRIQPWLTPAAAAGLSFVQASAIVFHAMRGETAETLVMNLVLLALSLFILWGRLKARPIAPRA